MKEGWHDAAVIVLRAYAQQVVVDPNNPATFVAPGAVPPVSNPGSGSVIPSSPQGQTVTIPPGQTLQVKVEGKVPYYILTRFSKVPLVDVHGVVANTHIPQFGVWLVKGGEAVEVVATSDDEQTLRFAYPITGPVIDIGS